MRIQTLAAAAVLSLAATISLSTTAFADQEKPDCVKVGDLKAEVNGRGCWPDKPINLPERDDQHKPRVNLCGGLMHGIIDDEKLHEVRDDVHDRFKDGKPCRDDESKHKRRSHDDPEERSSHHKKSDDSDSDDNDSSDSGDSDSDSKAGDDSDDDDDTTSTQVKVVPKGSVDTGDGSSL
jgi:hypothetical protein